MTLATSSPGGANATWYLINPTSGTNNVVINFASSHGSLGSAVSYTGSDTSNPFGATSFASGGSGNPSLSITTTADSSIIDDNLYYDFGQSLAPNSPEVSQITEQCGSGPNESHGFGTLTTTTHGSNTLGWTHGGTSSDWQEIAIEIKSAASTQTSNAANGSYTAKVDDGGRFNSYSFANDTWTMYDKKGNKYTFGSDDTGRLYDSSVGASTNTFKWMLQEIRDTNGNYVKYTYNRDSNQLYPNQIIYTGNGSTDGPAQITFATSSRPDTRVSYAPTFKVTTNYRISEIDALFNGTTVRKYLLGYGTGVNGKRSLLTTFQQQGYDENGVLTSLPAMTFSYASSSASFFNQNGTLLNQADVPADTVGKGVNEAITLYKFDTDGTLHAQSSSCGNVSAPDYWASNPPSTYSPLERGVRYIDVNGDGKPDVVRGWQDVRTGLEQTIQSVSINSSSVAGGCGWGGSWAGTTTNSTIPIFATQNSSFILSGGVFGDVNGDGLPDYETSLPGWQSAAAYLGDGSAWVSTSTIFAPAQAFPTTQPTPAASQLVDINGDGLDDWVSSDTSNTYVQLNTGTGWASADPAWTIPTSTLFFASGSGYTHNYDHYYDRGIRFVDINGDGLPDMVRGYHGYVTGTPSFVYDPYPELADVQAVYLNTGNGWATSTAYAPGYIATANVVTGWAGEQAFTFNELGNWTGNGQMGQDVLTRITNAKGGSTSVTYTPSAQLGTNPELPISLLVVTQTVANDGFGNTSTTTYSYAGGKMYLPSDVRDRKFAGFAIATTTAPDSVTASHFDQGDSISTADGEQSDGYAQINHPFRTDVFDLSKNLKQRTYYRWGAIVHGSSTAVVLGQKLTEDFASDGSHRDKASTFSYSSSTNDLLKRYDYGEVLGSADGTFVDIGTDGRFTALTYGYAPSLNLSVVVEKASGSAFATSSVTASSATSTAMDVLVVGGGGGGGGQNGTGGGGGGGAGGFREDNAHTVLAQAYTVTVGSGGSGGATSGQGGGGGASSFDTITSDGGGGGGAGGTSAASGASGASGGGAGAPSGSKGSGTSGEGHDGGTHVGGYVGAGGGGAGAVGQDANSNTNGANGGSGSVSSASGSSVTYAGGGGGGANNGSGGSGGSGGGGSGGANANNSGISSGAANTGGGGGGSGTGTASAGQPGGSGVVIIAAPLGAISSASGGSHTTSGSSDIWTFNSSGTWTVNGFGATYSYSTSTVTATTSDTKLYYDSLPFGQVSLGNNTRQEDWITGTQYASSTKTYNSYGLVATSTDRNGNATSYVYDGYNLFPATTTNALLQKTQFLYNSSNGQVKWSSDPNSSLTKNTFDGLGRLTAVAVSSTSTPTSYATTTEYAYVDSTSTLSYIKRLDYVQAASSSDSYQYFDGLNRIVQDRKASQTAGTYIASDRTYNPAGLLASASLPYFSSNASSTAATTTSALFTSTTYDALQRPLTVVNAVGTTTNAYGKWTTTTTDPNGNVKDYWSDAFGNLVNVVEHGSTLATTTYEYDPLNNLATTTDGLGNVRHFTHDGLSRRTSAQDLHAPSDATFGTWSYTYDDQGNLTSQTDPKNQVVNRTHDALNRMVTEDYTGQAGTEVTLAYDNCTNGIGYLCSASSPSATTTNAYDILGHITSATTTILGSAYNMQYTYDRQGNITGLTYPNATQVNVTYGRPGYPTRVQRKPLGGSFSDIVSSIDYSPADHVKTIVFGSGASTSRTYDANAIYRLSQLQTRGKGGSKIQNYGYTYDAVGNMTQIANPATALSAATTTFSYDALNHLQSASTTAASSSPYRQQYGYDVLGSILSLFSGGASSTYVYPGTAGYANPHAVTTLSSGYSTSTFSYDNNGNLIQKTTDGTSTTYVYDYANRLIALGVAGATTTYAYDWTGARVSQTGTSTTTIYPFKWYSVASSTGSGAKFSTTTSYVFNNDTLASTVDQQFASGMATGSAQTCYVHPDHLGSTNVVTDASGTVVQTLDYFPYGATRISTGQRVENRQYIGQFADPSSLDYLNARYYDPSRGQFLSEDPSFLAVGDPNQVKQVTGRDQQTFLADPQLANSSSYGRNNPIIQKDPDGKIIPLLGILAVYGAASLAVDAYDVYNMNFKYGSVVPQQWKDQTNFKAGYDLALTAVGARAAAVGLKTAGNALSVLTATGDALDTYFSDQIYKTYNDSQNPNAKKTILFSGNSTKSSGPGASGNSNVTRASTAGTRSQGGASYSSGGASYNQLVTNLSRVVAALSAYVSSLSASKSK
ncbi:MULTISPECIES: glycine-rich domain-containing protein [unclassified Bradyrhizobium]|uniref:glycine-rich domain-containing protein n=1 Tax=Bradyrhizobium sp. USDA 4541 TaxID=2817704 RepID=UPI00273A70AD|nr:RHS repeat-associated core domain-containing protein [Bradyrhizobium sp. USDA 4541]MCP1846752.1 RHS repeat-associated protein [Bradyrhizobium sp. USDA 4541]